jgi:hypothetical protein
VEGIMEIKCNKKQANWLKFILDKGLDAYDLGDKKLTKKNFDYYMGIDNPEDIKAFREIVRTIYGLK